jgi:hypothetical protein
MHGDDARARGFDLGAGEAFEEHVALPLNSSAALSWAWENA